MRKIRRVAANRVVVGSSTIVQCMVVLTDGIVTSYKPIDCEHAGTEWLGGTINLIEDSDGLIHAYKDGKPLC